MRAAARIFDSIIATMATTIALAFAIEALAAPPPVQGPRYSPPAAPTVAANQLDILGVEIQQNNLADAVRRLDSLVHDTPDALLASPDGGGTISLATWIDAMGDDRKKLLAGEYATQFGDAATRALRKLTERGSAEPAQMLAVARRYPFAPAATDAIVAAAQRCRELGDRQSARDLLDLARSRGWTDEAATKNQPMNPATNPAKTDGADRASERGGERGAERNAFRGVVPFDAPWFAAPEQLAFDRVIPVAESGTTFICTPIRTLALRPAGAAGAAMLWSANAAGESDDDVSDAPPRDRRRNRADGESRGISTRGATYLPVVVCDDAASPRIVLVRQPQSPAAASSPARSSSGPFVLRAFRASDGRLLWSTEDSSDLRGLTIASSPAVVGRYVYALAADTGQQSDRLLMVALELTTGRALWRTEIGSIARRQVLTRYNRPRDPVLDAADPWQNLSAPAAAGDSVYVAPNAGCAIALDRFDGHIRWIRPYDPALEPEDAAAKARRAAQAAAGGAGRQNRDRAARPANREGVVRWTVTPQIIDNTLLVAPLDNDRVVAINARSGEKLWHTDDLAASTLIGVSTNRLAIFQERSIAALDKEGEVKWTWDDRSTGPACVAGDFIYIPTADGIVTILATDGRLIKKPIVQPPDLPSMLRNDTVRAALTAAGVIDRFTTKERDEKP